MLVQLKPIDLLPRKTTESSSKKIVDYNICIHHELKVRTEMNSKERYIFNGVPLLT